MKNTRCLIITCGYFGDIIFASSLAEKLVDKYDFIDYLIGFPQIETLINNNPYINTTLVSDSPSPLPFKNNLDVSKYDRIIQLQPLNYNITPCEEYQSFAGIKNTSSEYRVYTSPEYDAIAQEYILGLIEHQNKPVVGIMSNWQPKTYLFTKEQYIEGIDVPNLGYGGSHRNIQYIIDSIQDSFTMIPIGVDHLSQHQTVGIEDDNFKSITFESSLLKYCDAFIGTEGGLANIAAGVGCRTILTGDFIHQLYGWNGVLKKIQKPQLGPDKYFKDMGHVMIDPYLTDDEVIQKIKEILL